MSDEVLCRTVVLVGKTGNGKSATGNTILGSPQFKSASGADGVTKTIQTAKYEQATDTRHVELTIVDTPGLFDCRNVLQTASELQTVVKKKPHVFLLVLKAGRFTDEEKGTVDMLEIIFGDSVFKHTIVVVTHGGNFTNDEEWNQFKNSKNVAQLIKLCDNRIMKFENQAQEFNFSEFCQYLTDIDTIYRNEYEEIRKSVIAKYCKDNYGDTISRKKLRLMLMDIEFKKAEQILKKTAEEMEKRIEHKTDLLRTEFIQSVQELKDEGRGSIFSCCCCMPH